MKLVIAVIQPTKLNAVREALEKIEVTRLTVCDAQGFGRQRGRTEMYRGHEYTTILLRKVALEIVVNDDFLDRTLEHDHSAWRGPGPRATSATARSSSCRPWRPFRSTAAAAGKGRCKTKPGAGKGLNPAFHPPPSAHHPPRYPSACGFAGLSWPSPTFGRIGGRWGGDGGHRPRGAAGGIRSRQRRQVELLLGSGQLRGRPRPSRWRPRRAARGNRSAWKPSRNSRRSSPGPAT